MKLIKFTVEIQNTPFTTPEHFQFESSVLVTFENDEDKIKKTVRYGYRTKEEIISIVDNKGELNLNYCYVDWLSLSEYRLEKGLPRKQTIRLKALSGSHAFFNPDGNIDLNHLETLDENIKFEESLFARGSFSLNNSNFADGIICFSQSEIHCNEMDFSYNKFSHGKKLFKNMTFHDCHLKFNDTDFGVGDVLFNNTDFGSGDISFINCKFGKGEISFKVARFGNGKKDFHYAKFLSDSLSFERTEFNDGKVDFRTVEFGNTKVNFNRSSFGHGEISFEACQMESSKFNFKKVVTLSGGLNFSLAEFDGSEVYFDGSNIRNGTFSFYNSRFKLLSLKSCHFDYYTDLRLDYALILDLSDTVVRDIIDLKPYDFKVNIQSIYFEGMRLVGRLYLSWKDNNLKTLIENQQHTSHKSKSEQYRVLKQNFNQTGQYDDEDKAYVMFKRHELKSLLEEKTSQNQLYAIWEYPRYLIQKLIFDQIGLYATSPVRVLVSVVFFWFLFGLFFNMAELLNLGHTVSSVGNPDNIPVWLQGFYHSAITFFTIGYGDVYPQGISRIISAVEGFAGVFMMSYFTVAFVRKILR